MALVDHERAWLRLKEYVLSRRSHGQDNLLGEIARLEIECEVSEGERDFDARPARDLSASDPPSLEPPDRQPEMAAH